MCDLEVDGVTYREESGYTRTAIRGTADLDVPAGVSKVRLKGNIDWTFGGSGYRHIWVHKNGAPLFGTAKESDQGDSGVQSIGSGVVNVTPGDCFDFIARQTSSSTKNVAADELSWFAVEVLE